MAPRPQDQPLPATLPEAIWRYASGQSFNNILLAAILATVGSGLYYTVSQGIPAHLRQIQAGYEKIAAEHARETERSDALIRDLIGRPRLPAPGVVALPND